MARVVDEKKERYPSAGGQEYIPKVGIISRT